VPTNLAKAHAYGNDFLYERADDWSRRDWSAHARQTCDRHRGAGADGLIIYAPTATGARMRLFNADGSNSEVSGNGVRGLAAWLCWKATEAGRTLPGELIIDTDAGPKRLELLAAEGPRFTLRAAMGPPTEVTQTTLDVAGERVTAIVLRVGNPQCVVLEPVLDEERYRRLGPALATHVAFPHGTNVEFARVTHPRRVDILIWERGVGPTLASGTGACAAAVAAMAYGGAERSVDVVSPGGAQRVDWTDDGLFLTGWAEVVWEGQWID
jgi:diaminopimelate epimerase